MYEGAPPIPFYVPPPFSNKKKNVNGTHGNVRKRSHGREEGEGSLLHYAMCHSSTVSPCDWAELPENFGELMETRLTAHGDIGGVRVCLRIERGCGVAWRPI